MNSKITYHQQVSYCGKPRCRKCREGTGHGPYWYAYQTVEGRTTRTYVGKELPAEVLAEMNGYRELPPTQRTELAQATIRIYALGQFRLERRSGRDVSWQTVTDSAWQHQRVRSLLGCLVSAGRKLGREQIMEALWPDLDIETAASRLDRAVYSLRQLFEPSRSRLATSPLLLTERETVVLGEQTRVWVDADAFEHLLAQAHSSTDPGESERLLEEAMMLYGGDFLPEEKRMEWALVRRESLQRSWIGLLLELADRRIARQSLATAIEPLDRLLSIDPTNEAAVQRFIWLLAQLGRRGEALRTYRRLVTVLQQEYRIAPLPETRALYESIRLGHPPPAGARLVSHSASGAAAPTGEPAPRRQEAPPTVQIGRSHQSPLVGREQELGLLIDLVKSTERTTRFKPPGQRKPTHLGLLDTQRRPQCMLLMGEVGIGKTRLAEEVSREAKKGGWAVAWSRVYAQERSIPYRLWTEILRKAMEQGMWQRQEVQNRPLVFQPLGALLPELNLPQISYTAAQSPEQEQLRLWEAARELLTLISEGTPLLIALDDLQWSDHSSCELLAYLARRIQGYPIVIVGTCRDNELAADHPLRPLLTDLHRERAVESIPLEPLSDEQIATLVSYVPDLPEPIVNRIRHRAAGNPFFAEELARTIGSHLIEGGSLDLSRDDAPSLPDTINAVLDLRLSRLSTDCQRLLAKAAVLGGSFEFNVINEMEAGTPGFDEDLVLERLEEGLKAGMLTEEGTGTRVTYHFWHPLLVNHLYERLSAARRASLHRRAAEILRRLYQGREEEGAATITRHLVGGGASPQQIAHYAELAGNHAYGLSSYPDAEHFYRVALEHLEVDGEEEQRHRAHLLEYLGECTRIQGKYEEARRIYEQTLEVRSRLQIFPVDVLQEAQLQAMLWGEVGLTWYDTGDIALAQHYCTRGEQVLREAGILSGSAWAWLHFRQGYISWREGDYEKAHNIALDTLQLFKETSEGKKDVVGHFSRLTRIRRTLAGDLVDLGRVSRLLGIIESSGGRPREALSYYNMALTLFEQYDCLRDIGIVCCDLGDLYLGKAEYANAQAVLRRSLSIVEQIGDFPVMSFVVGNLGLLDLRFGNLADAENEHRQSIDLAERIGDDISMGMLRTGLAIVLLEQGKLGEARYTLHNALVKGHAKHIVPSISFALIALGKLRIAQALEISLNEIVDDHSLLEMRRLLNRARKTLKRALSLEGMEAETRTDGQLTLAQSMLLLGETEEALQLVGRTMEEAHQYELIWLIANAQRLLGNIFCAQAQYEQAAQYFEQARRTFQKCNMRLEHGRTLYQHGLMLVQQDDDGGKMYQRGLEYLREAHQLFLACGAALDVRMAERELGRCAVMSKG